MPKKTKRGITGETATLHSVEPALSLHFEVADKSNANVNAEEFFAVAGRWLKALQAFASDSGQKATWEIVELKKSSAFVQVRPVKPQSNTPITALVDKWDESIREIQKTGHSSSGFNTNSLRALHDFVIAVRPDTAVSLGMGIHKNEILITAEMQRRVEEAVANFSSTVPLEYSVRGQLRGRLAVLNSWNRDDRSFRLQIPVAPGKPVVCNYQDTHLVNELGLGFEGTVEIDGLLHYRRAEVWPHKAEVNRIRVLREKDPVALKSLVGLLSLPSGLDSVSYVRSIRNGR